MRNDRLLPLLSLFILVACAEASARDLPAVDAAARADMQALGVPGMVLAVGRPGSQPHLAAFGLADVETGQPMTPELMVSVASVSKLLTAVTTVALAGDGALSLDRPVRTYLPKLPPRVGALTLHQLLSHTAGLAEATPWVPIGLDGSMAPVCDALTDDVFVTEPGRTWGYSNTDYVIAGCVLEAVAGKPFPEVVRQRVFEPLGMTRSTFSPLIAMSYPHAQGHDVRGESPVVLHPFESEPPLAPAGELMTTVGDLFTLASVLLNDGEVDGRQVLPHGILSELAQARGHGGAYLGGTRDYGLGLFSRDHDGIRILEHEGVYSGFGASFAMAPELGIAAVAVTNGRYSAPAATTQAAIDILAGRPVRPVTARRVPIAPADSSAIIGAYSSTRPVFRIETVDGRLSLVTGQGSYPLAGREEGHLEVPGFPPYLPIPATPLELVRERDGTISFVRLGWRVYRHVR